jgi:hypothetical protein
LTFISQHDYPGGDARKATNAPAARDKILSPAIDDHYTKFSANFVPAIISDGLPYRLEEANSFYDGGALDVSDTFASALWALDYQWWWAAHHASGINFHTGDKVAARDENKPCRYAVFWTSPDGYNIHPIGYALKMFSLGSHGQFVPTKIENPDNLNIVTYASAADKSSLCFTLINREHGADAKTIVFTLHSGLAKSSARAMTLLAPGNDISAKTSITLGSATIQDDGNWNGTWTPIFASEPNGDYTLKLPPAGAALVNITAR